MHRLTKIRREYKVEKDTQESIEQRHLEFLCWLVATGRLVGQTDRAFK